VVHLFQIFFYGWSVFDKEKIQKITNGWRFCPKGKSEAPQKKTFASEFLYFKSTILLKNDSTCCLHALSAHKKTLNHGNTVLEYDFFVTKYFPDPISPCY
jgi:hypothetical protein